MIQLRIQTEFN